MKKKLLNFGQNSNSNKQSQMWICRNAKLPSLQYFFFYFVTMTIIIKWTNWHLLTCGCFPPQQYGYTDSPYSTGQGINTQSATGILNQEFMHWFYELKPLTRRQQALTGLQTSCLPLMYLSESPCTQHWAALPWSTFSTLSTLSAPRCTKSDLSAPRNI